jgi:myb proto-oncogene protein
VVLELQAQFGNKWAMISTYLSGRTDNDVKNFWSTRQKRLARLLGTPLRGRSSRSRSARAQAPAASSLESRPTTVVKALTSLQHTLPAPLSWLLVLQVLSLAIHCYKFSEVIICSLNLMTFSFLT